MSGFFGKIGYNLRNLLRFSGRETRAVFWPYAIALYLLARAAQFAVTLSATIESMNQMFDGDMSQGGNGKPGTPIALTPETIAASDQLNLIMAAIDLVLLFLLAAACVRRLHDCNRTGLWLLLIVPTRALWLLSGYGDVAAPGTLPDLTLLALIAVAGILFWGASILLIYFLAAEGTQGPNRFGTDALFETFS
jgi:uncharacterized membrane protein YhaH (DUF805 family)